MKLKCVWEKEGRADVSIVCKQSPCGVSTLRAFTYFCNYKLIVLTKWSETTLKANTASYSTRLLLFCCLLGSILQGAEGSVFNDLSGLGSAARALCGPARQPSSPAPPAASADWPELQQPLPEKKKGESGTLWIHTAPHLRDVGTEQQLSVHKNSSDTVQPATLFTSLHAIL